LRPQAALSYGGGEALNANADGNGATRGHMSTPHASFSGYFRNAFTWQAYVKTSSPNEGGIMGWSAVNENWNQGSKALFVRNRSGQAEVEWDTGWVGNPRTGAYIHDNAWHQLVVTYNPSGDQFAIYVDGVAEWGPGGHGVDNHGEQGNQFFHIGYGCQNFIGNEFTGLIDEVAIFDEELTGADLTTLLTQGAKAWMEDGTAHSIQDGDWHVAGTWDWGGDPNPSGVPTDMSLVFVDHTAATRTVTVAAGNAGFALTLDVAAGNTVDMLDDLTVGEDITGGGVININAAKTLSAANLSTGIVGTITNGATIKATNTLTVDDALDYDSTAITLDTNHVSVAPTGTLTINQELDWLTDLDVAGTLVHNNNDIGLTNLNLSGAASG